MGLYLVCLFTGVLCFLLGYYLRMKEAQNAWRENDPYVEDDEDYHSRYRMITIDKEFQLIAIWHGAEGWKTFIRERYYTVPLFEIEHIKEMPPCLPDYSLHFCVSKDEKALGFYAVYGEKRVSDV